MSESFLRTCSAALIGTEGHLLHIHAKISTGRPGFYLDGLSEQATDPTRDRMRAAIINSGLAWPQESIRVQVRPAGLPLHGAASADLAIAVALLAASSAIPTTDLDRWIMLGELGLDGKVRPVRDVLAMIRAATAAGLSGVVVPTGNAAEAAQVEGIRVVGVTDLAHLVGRLRAGELDAQAHLSPAAGKPTPCVPAASGHPMDLADVAGDLQARRALEIAAAGGHHLFLTGHVGSGCALLAERLPTILPDLNPRDAREVNGIYSAAGLLLADQPWITRPPLISPDHTTASSAIFGTHRPGAVSLAHRGVLFLNKAAEFPSAILQGLQRVIETGSVMLANRGSIIRYPARFTLVLASPPCPCLNTAGCACTPQTMRRYLARLTCLLDRVEIRTHVSAKRGSGAPGESSATVAERVAAARERTAARLAGTPWQTNAEIPLLELRTTYPAAPGAREVLDHAIEASTIPTSAYARVLRVAWTIADLRGGDRPDRNDVAEALALWNGAHPEPPASGPTGS